VGQRRSTEGGKIGWIWLYCDETLPGLLEVRNEIERK
jgi:hypothetical protein